jgi:hypothetical protein
LIVARAVPNVASRPRGGRFSIADEDIRERAIAMIRPCILAAALAVASIGSAAAQPRAGSYGAPIESWTFSWTDEARGVVNCRAIRKAGGREDILAMRTRGGPYVSVRGNGRIGKYRDSIVESGAITWTVPAEANGARLWFSDLLPAAIETIAARGGFTYYLGGTEDTEKVNLGRSAAAAWARVKECTARFGG